MIRSFLLFGLLVSLTAAEPLRFSRDVQPILSDHCFTCHGPDEKSRKAKLRLDIREDAVREAILPGNAKDSEVIFRLHSTDPDELMPPPEMKKPLTEEEKDILARWINEGAEYEAHWAFIPAVKAELPSGKAVNPIDRFVSSTLDEAGITPSPRAPDNILLRRLSLDLTGIAPSREELAAFDGDVDAAINRLYTSPRYAEHLTREWLDVSRYADSSGYQYDKERTMWPWRDWVIGAFQSNMPFDQFTIEQLAGDLLEAPTEHQRLATGFNRNHPITIEGGVIDEEYRIEYVMDRINTVGTAWLGLTLGCARCHDHKYDPISQKEFYELFAFFNQVPERGHNGFNPQMQVFPPLAASSLKDMDEQIATKRASWTPSEDEITSWRQSLKPGPWQKGGAITALRVPADAPETVTLTAIPPGTESVSGQFVRISRSGKGIYLQIAELEVLAAGKNVAREGTVTQSTTGHGGLPRYANDGNRSGIWAHKTITHTAMQDDPWLELDLGTEHVLQSVGLWGRTDCCPERLDQFTIEILNAAREVVWIKPGNSSPSEKGQVIALGGPELHAFVRNPGLPADVRVPSAPLVKRPGLTIEPDSEVLEVTADSAWTSLAQLPSDVLKQLTTPHADLSAACKRWSAKGQALEADIAALEERRKQLAAASAVSVMVMQDMPKPRDTHILNRGQYNEKLDVVTVNVPEILPALGPELPRNRLGFAQWLVEPDHPLTARVIVNRVWQRIFGIGLVKSSEDFGIQGERPTHPELLDWLAVDFIEHGWDLQHLQRLILQSDTYARSSVYRDDIAAVDPENRLLARASRIRMTAEEIRDNTLHAAGVLKDQLGGPPVYPYQPEGLWLEVNNRKGYSRAYPAPNETDLFRRSLYTFGKRTVPHPSLQTFDAPNREFCTVKRSRTNTPLQALALLHAPEYVEAARHLGERMLAMDGTMAARLSAGFEQVASRTPSQSELDILTLTLKQEHARFTADPAAAETLLGVGISPRDTTLDSTEHAAMTSVARLLLNLDEAIHKN